MAGQSFYRFYNMKDDVTGVLCSYFQFINQIRVFKPIIENTYVKRYEFI